MGTWGGTYARGAMPEASNTGAHTSGRERPSGFVNKKVRTSLGLASSQLLTVVRYAVGVTPEKSATGSAVNTGAYLGQCHRRTTTGLVIQPASNMMYSTASLTQPVGMIRMPICNNTVTSLTSVAEVNDAVVAAQMSVSAHYRTTDESYAYRCDCACSIRTPRLS